MSRILRLLIVDDTEAWRELLRAFFEERPDIVIAEASSGTEAVAKIKAEDFDLILLDMRMPSGTEGFDTLSEIKRLKPNTDVIMMIAYGDIPRTVEAMKRGARDFVAKEADFKDIIIFKVNEYIRTAHLIADRELLILAKYHEAINEEDTHKKGRALEELLAALIASIEGFIEFDRNVNTATEEIDIVFRNESRDLFWQKFGPVFLVECKNWKSQSVGKNEFNDLYDKMKNRGGQCNLGFLVCTEDFADTIDTRMLRVGRGKRLIVPINGERLRELVESTDRNALLKDFTTKASLK